MGLPQSWRSGGCACTRRSSQPAAAIERDVVWGYGQKTEEGLQPAATLNSDGRGEVVRHTHTHARSHIRAHTHERMHIRTWMLGNSSVYVYVHKFVYLQEKEEKSQAGNMVPVTGTVW